MKKILAFVAVFVMASLITSCGISSKVTNDPYTGKGYGESVKSENYAHNIAFDNAVADIARKYNRSVSENTVQNYTNDDSGRGRATESLVYNSNLNEKSRAVLGDVVIVKEKLRKKGRKWICDITVAVAPGNIE